MSSSDPLFCLTHLALVSLCSNLVGIRRCDRPDPPFCNWTPPLGPSCWLDSLRQQLHDETGLPPETAIAAAGQLIAVVWLDSLLQMSIAGPPSAFVWLDSFLQLLIAGQPAAFIWLDSLLQLLIAGQPAAFIWLDSFLQLPVAGLLAAIIAIWPDSWQRQTGLPEAGVWTILSCCWLDSVKGLEPAPWDDDQWLK
jgi:hypothetical protein